MGQPRRSSLLRIKYIEKVARILSFTELSAKKTGNKKKEAEVSLYSYA